MVAVAAGQGSARAEHCDDGALRQTCAAAESGSSWYDFGLAWSQFSSGGANPGLAGGDREIATQSVRFGLGVRLASHVYLGGDADFGRIYNASAASPPVDGRSTAIGGTMAPPGTLPLHGNVGVARAIVGVFASAGRLTGGAELAPGFRLATYGSNDSFGNQSQDELVVEGRGRLSVLLTPALTLGAVVGVDLRDHREVSAALSLGVHFGPHSGL